MDETCAAGDDTLNDVASQRLLNNPTQLARLVVRCLPRLSQKIVVAPWGALHDELRLLTGLVVDGVVDGSEFRA
jgi:hypothetical protein